MRLMDNQGVHLLRGRVTKILLQEVVDMAILGRQHLLALANMPAFEFAKVVSEVSKEGGAHGAKAKWSETPKGIPHA